MCCSMQMALWFALFTYRSIWEMRTAGLVVFCSEAGCVDVRNLCNLFLLTSICLQALL